MTVEKEFFDLFAGPRGAIPGFSFFKTGKNFFLQSNTIYANIFSKHIFLFTFDKANHFSGYQKIYALNSNHYN